MHGLSGAAVRSLQIDELAVLVSDFNADTVAVTRENALDHAAVVRSVLDRTTPLPFRFGTLVTEQQLRSYISARKPALQTRFAHVRGCVEMSVKIIREVSKDNEAPRDEITSGTSFLKEKRRKLFGSEQKATEATEISVWLHEQIDGMVRDEQVTLRPSEKLVLAAAYLVARDKIPQYKEKLASARKNRPELHFLFSGPWPPYSFANIELEFKTQFGVS
ncbi:MAG TPA: GvpL/GvpF family gas vesicle protein [Pyrinomonadaceae bacterium]|nr:GvpL/GvpF family gas vesicle protein [Pyrinomonadaceae bacterium]